MLAGARAELALRHDKQAQTDDAILARHDEDRGRTAERDRLDRRHLELSTAARRLAERRVEHAARLEERKLVDFASDRVGPSRALSGGV